MACWSLVHACMLFTVIIIIIIIIIIIFSSFAACTVEGSERQPVPWEGWGGGGVGGVII